jgi:glycosyltransferase involved in cell wall biosynthesis
VPNGVDTDRYAPTGVPRDPNALLFIGTLDFRPNVDAVRWFATEVLPIVRRARPTARFVVAGRSPAPSVLALASESVEVVGPVDDDRDLLAICGVSVVPLRSGGGMRFKVVQSMACGAPVVSTRFGAEGAAVQDGEHLLLADDPADFASAVIRTLEDAVATRARVERARALAVDRYDWRAILPALHAVYDRLAERVPTGALR